MVERGRWNPWFEDMIQISVAAPTRAVIQGAAVKFELDILDCPKPYIFRVILEYSPRNDGQPRGLITAVQDFF